MTFAWINERDARKGEGVKKYTVTTRDGERDCGHAHKTKEAAERCRLRMVGNAQYYGSEIRRDGERPSGLGTWSDGETATY